MSSLKAKQTVVISFLTQLFLLLRVAPLQVDLHHDGVILAAAISFSEGGIPNKDAFAQYGPLSPIIQGLVLRFTSNSLLSLRLLTSIIVFSISIILFKIMRLKFNEVISISISNIWIFTAPIWSTSFPGTLLPWPSLFSTALTLGAAYLLVKEEKSIKTRKPILVLSGALVGLAGLSRGQAWLLIGFIFLLCLMLRRIQHLLLILSGFFGILITYLFYLLTTNSLWDFIDQVWVWPVLKYTTLGINRFEVTMVFLGTIVFLALLFTNELLNVYIKSKNCRILVLSFLLVANIAIGREIVTTLSVPTIPRLVLGEPLDRILLSPMYASIFFLFVKVISSIRRKEKGFGNYLLFSVAITGVIQLYPQADVMHMWWIAPLVFPILITSNSEKIQFFLSSHKRNLLAISATLSIMGIICAINFILVPRLEYSAPVLKGTYARAEMVHREAIFNEILNYSIKGESSFDCQDGVFSVLDGHYNAADEWFVNWGIIGSSKKGSIRFICNQSKPYVNAEARKLGMTVVLYQKDNHSKESLGVLRSQSKVK